MISDFPPELLYSSGYDSFSLILFIDFSGKDLFFSGHGVGLA